MNAPCFNNSPTAATLPEPHAISSAVSPRESMQSAAALWSSNSCIVCSCPHWAATISGMSCDRCIVKMSGSWHSCCVIAVRSPPRHEAARPAAPEAPHIDLPRSDQQGEQTCLTASSTDRVDQRVDWLLTARFAVGARSAGAYAAAESSSGALSSTNRDRCLC